MATPSPGYSMILRVEAPAGLTVTSELATAAARAGAAVTALDVVESHAGLPPEPAKSIAKRLEGGEFTVTIERVAAAGGEIVVFEAPGSPHVHPLLPTPEGRAARRSFIATVAAGL